MKFSARTNAAFFLLATGGLNFAQATGGIRGGGQNTELGDDVDINDILRSPTEESSDSSSDSTGVLLGANDIPIPLAGVAPRIDGDDETHSTQGTHASMAARHQHTASAPTHKKKQRRVMIKYKAGSKSQLASRIAIADNRQRAAGYPAVIRDLDFDEMDTIVITADSKTIAELENDPDIESVEDDAVVYPSSMQYDDDDDDAEGGSRSNHHDNNTKKKQKNPKNHLDLHHAGTHTNRNLAEWLPWGVSDVQAPQMWAAGHKGQGVKVCVIDSGIDYYHSDFVTSNLSGKNTDLLWYNDNCGHGTHVAGTIAAKDDNCGVIGVAPEAEIFVIRVFEFDTASQRCGSAYTSETMDAARKCRDFGADIINMSLGGASYSSAAEVLYTSLLENDGILTIAAAGNDGNTDKSYPGSYSAVMSVAAVDKNKRLASFSQRNSEVDIAAPGVDIWSTSPGNKFDEKRGTSMATPHVSGVAALLMSAVPSANASTIRAAMENSAQDLGSSGRDNSYGHGFVRASAALQQLGSGGDTGGSCSNSPSGWYDSDGTDFNCDWYGSGSNCQEYGDFYANFGKTANQACCACGGGSNY